MLMEIKYVMVSDDLLNEINNRLKRIESNINTSQETIVNDEFISEKDAIDQLGKKKSWFWNQRQKGLKVYKMGNTPYYSKKELLTLIK